MRKILVDKIASDEFQVTSPKESTNKNRCYNYKRPYPILQYIPTVAPINLQGS